jgi:hypothetical protein
MSTTKRIDGVWSKVERANKHIADLEALISSFLGRDFYSLGTKPKPQIAHVVYYVTRVDPLPREVPLILGDVLHNLRGSLDHLFWQLVEVLGGTPGVTTQFPITKTLEQYDSAFGKREITQITRACPEAIEILTSIQPYRTTDDTLWHLHKLNIEDKHLYLGMSPGKLRRLTQSGELPIVQHEEHSPWLYDLHDLDSHIEKSKRRISDFL